MEKSKIVKMVEILSSMNYNVVQIDEHITNVFKTYGEFEVSIYFNDLCKRHMNEFDDLEFNVYKVFKNDKELDSSGNLYELLMNITEDKYKA